MAAASNGTKLGAAALVLALAAGLIMKWEGLPGKKDGAYMPYLDPVGIWTVCYGHTGPEVIPGGRYTYEDCRELLKKDMAVAQKQVRRCIRTVMTPYQEAALISLVFNVGPRGVCGSDLQAFANAGDWEHACAQLDRWKYAGGRVYKGLVRRRADERAVCEGRDFSV